MCIASQGSKTAAGKKESNKNAPAKGTPAPASAAAKPAAAAGNLEDEVKAFLRQTGPVKSNELVTRFKNRLKSPEVRVNLYLLYGLC